MCCKEFWYILGTYQDAKDFLQTKDFQPIQDLAHTLLLILVVAFQTDGLKIVPSDKLGGALKWTLLVGQVIALLLDTIALVKNCNEGLNETAWLDVVKLPLDVFLLIVAIAENPETVHLVFGYICSVIQFVFIVIIVVRPHRMPFAVRGETFKLMTKYSYQLAIAVFLFALTSKNPVWEKTSLDEKKVWFQIAICMISAFQIYYSYLSIQTINKRRLNNEKRKNRHFCHQLFFGAEAVFSLVLFLYASSEVKFFGVLACILKSVLYFTQYVVFHFGFEGEFRFTSIMSQLQFKISGDRKHKETCWEPHPNIYDFEDDQKPAESAAPPQIPTEADDLVDRLRQIVDSLPRLAPNRVNATTSRPAEPQHRLNSVVPMRSQVSGPVYQPSGQPYDPYYLPAIPGRPRYRADHEEPLYPNSAYREVNLNNERPVKNSMTHREQGNQQRNVGQNYDRRLPNQRSGNEVIRLTEARRQEENSIRN